MSMDHKFDIDHFLLIVDKAFDSNNPNLMGSQLIHLLVSFLGVKGASIFVVNPRTEALEILATEGLSMAYRNKGPILVDQSIKLESNLNPIIISDTRTSDQLQYPEKAEQEGIRSIISLPINLRGKIIGALRVYHASPWEVSVQDLAYLKLLSKYIGMALRYFRLAAVVQCTKDTLDEIHPLWL